MLFFLTISATTKGSTVTALPSADFYRYVIGLSSQMDGSIRLDKGGNTDLLFYAFSKDFQEFGAVLRIYFAHICNLEHSHFIEDAFAGINRIAVFFHG